MCVPRPGNKDDIKLIDFGMSKVLENGKELKVACGTPEFVGKWKMMLAKKEEER